MVIVELGEIWFFCVHAHEMSVLIATAKVFQLKVYFKPRKSRLTCATASYLLIWKQADPQFVTTNSEKNNINFVIIS